MKIIIPDWREAYKLASVQVAGLWGLWAMLPEAQQLAVLDLFGVPQSKVPGIVALTFIISRLIKQRE